MTLSKTDLSMGNDQMTRDVTDDLNEALDAALNPSPAGANYVESHYVEPDRPYASEKPDPAQVAEAPSVRFAAGGLAREPHKPGEPINLMVRRDTSFSLASVAKPRARAAFTGALNSNSVALEDLLQNAQRGQAQLSAEMKTAEDTILFLDQRLQEWTAHHSILSGEAHQRGEQIKFLRRSIRDLEDQQIASRRAAEDSVDH